MNSFLKTAFFYFNKIKVVHSIPGRLRLYIPGMEKVPNEMRKYDYYTTNLIKLHNGIEDISYSYITGKILLTYDVKKQTKKKLLTGLILYGKKLLKMKKSMKG